MASQSNSRGGNSRFWDKVDIKALQVKEEEGSEAARKFLKTFQCNAELTEILDSYDYSESQSLKIVELLYTCWTLNNQNLVGVHLEEKLNLIVCKLYKEKCDEICDIDMKIRFCFCVLNLNPLIRTIETEPVDFIKTNINRYPDNCNFYFVLLVVLSSNKEYKQGLSFANEALKKFPQNIDLLYCRAVSLKNTVDTKSHEIVKAFEDFFNVAPKDHRKLPEAYYHLSSVYVREYLENTTELNWHQIESYYESGVRAENDQLPCYLPYEDGNKSVIGDILKSKKNLSKPKKLSENVNAITATVLEKKPYLSKPNRKSIIHNHREALQKCELFQHIGFSQQSHPQLQRLLRKVSSLKPITLQQMNPKKDSLFENRIIELLIIDDPIQLPYSINLITEDVNGNASPLLLRNMKKEIFQKFQAGCKLAIINPYIQCGNNNKIINDEPDCIVYLEKVNSMCRYCGEGNASNKCSKCKRPYCSRECQKLDWKELDHKLICSLKLETSFAETSTAQAAGK